MKKVVQDLTSGGIDWQREKWQSGHGSKFIHQGEKNAVKYADEIIVLSKGVQDYFKETYGRETHFIPNGVNRPQIREANLITDRFGLKKDSYILFLGRLVPEKGIRYLVEAFKNVKTDKKLVIAGGSSDTDSFMAELKELAKGDDRILFTGFVQGAMLDELYSNAYIYTLPSDLEGMPLSLLEAMSYGNCCLVSDIPECAEVVEDKALIFKKSDVDDLREKLQNVDNTYYEAVKTLQELAEQGGANLTLMGIEPTYPSEKYGYIIPKSSENVSKVKEFKEKPDVETAKKYLAQSALWNAGIFAFKLGYLLDKAHSMIDFEDYRDLFNKYDTLTKISFDYAVVEKESSIQVLRYSGDWKDVGTWNMMAEVMADKTKGKAVLDETCENTNVVNELNIPILCMGCKDMIVAASGDGILIADKERSGYMKPYVEKIETEAMYAEKSWGSYTVIDVQPGSMTVKISMRAGEHMTYHMHNYREEVWTVVSGKGKAVVDGMEQVLRTGDVITIAAGCKHTVEAITALDMIEVQLGDEISVADGCGILTMMKTS